MRNRILEIVVFLMDYMRDNTERSSGTDELSATLLDMGYSEHEINTAYDWFLDQFSSNTEEYYSAFPIGSYSSRIFTEQERIQLSTEAQGFLLKLNHSGILNNEQLEIILERTMLLTGEAITLEQIKIVVSSVIFKDYEQVDNQDFFDSNFTNSGLLN